MINKLILILVGIMGAGVVVFFRFNENEQPLRTPSAQKTTQSVTPQTTKPAVLANTNTTAPYVAADIDTQNNQDYATFTTMTLWDDLLAGFKQGNYKQIPLEDALIARLRQESGDEVYGKFVEIFRLRAITPAAQQLLISLLGEIATYQAGETLMQLLKEHLIQSPDVKLTTLHAIDKFVPELWYEHSNAELSPVFEAAWQTIDDPTFLSAIAHVMAKIGRPQSLVLFTQTLTDNNNNKRVAIVKQAMADFENPALITDFAANLQSSPSKEVQWASGYALANMGQSAATAVLLDWSTRADASQVAWVKDWFEIAMSTTPTFVQWLDLNLSTQQFNSLEIKQTIENVLVNIKGDGDD